MCGIAGFCKMPERWQENIRRMTDRMVYRGPDAEGFWAEENAEVVLGHRRLSIIDLSPGGAQPMISRNERYVICYNGEIYNHEELRQELEGDGFTQWRGHSDTEVLLEYIAQHGMDAALSKAKGMFAIALYDRKERVLRLARDRIGEKPLYYGFCGGGFLFASDLNALRGNPNFVADLDKDALTLYLRYSYIPAPYTIYKGIRKLEAGSILELSYPYELPKLHTWWDLKKVAQSGQQAPFTGSYTEAVDQLEQLLKNAIAGQMVADVPVGAFLSGGIDSSVVTAVMQKLSHGKVRSFSIGFQEARYDESPYAAAVSEHLDTEHTAMYVMQKEAMDVIPKLPGIFGEPFADPSQIPTYLLSCLTKKHVTVSLSGDAGDELFYGYNTYEDVCRVWNIQKKCPAFIRKGIAGLAGGLGGQPGKNKKLWQLHSLLPLTSPEDIFEKVDGTETDGFVLGGAIPEFKHGAYQRGFLSTDMESNLMLMDMGMSLPDDMLVKVDRAGMAASLETRIPLLDRDIVEFAWKLPISWKKEGKLRKKILRDVLYRYVPRELIDRPKQGFSVPVGEWIRGGSLHEWAAELLAGERIRRQGILNEKLVTGMWEAFQKKGIYTQKIWNLLMLQQWIEDVGGQ